jgi:MFS family permease
MVVDDVRSRGWRRLLPEPGPARVLVLCSAIASVGNGLYLAGSAVYFVRVVGLSPAEVGLGLSVAGLAGLVLAVPLGHLADRVGPRGVAAGLAVIKALLLVLACTVGSFTTYVVMIGALGVVESGGAVARGALVSGLLGRAGRVRVSAYLRAVFNAGFTLGVVGAGLAIAVDRRPAYLVLLLGNAAAMLLVAGFYLRLPRVPGVPKSPVPHHSWSALRDVPYLAVAQVSGLARLGPVIAAVGLPLWLITHTSAPRPLAAWLTVVNTVIVVLFQVRASRGADTVDGASRLQRRTFVTLAVGCAVTGLAGGVRAAPVAAAILAVATVLYSLGEIWGEAARWGLRYELAPDRAQGQYGGAFASGDAVANIAGPTLAAGLPQVLGVWGWAVLAVVFVAGLLAGTRVVAWAAATREPAPDPAGAAVGAQAGGGAGAG